MKKTKEWTVFNQTKKILAAKLNLGKIIMKVYTKRTLANI
jgi:hypothetical protein